MKQLCWLLLLLPVLWAQYVVPPVSLPSAPYVEWAHTHFIWLNGKSQTQTLLTQLVSDYLQRDIPVGGINIDSAWSTGYNNFIWNTFDFFKFFCFLVYVFSKTKVSQHFSIYFFYA